MGDEMRLWQVTCQCGWRTKGTQDEVVAAVKEHAKTTHGQELSAQEVMQKATEL